MVTTSLSSSTDHLSIRRLIWIATALFVLVSPRLTGQSASSLPEAERARWLGRFTPLEAVKRSSAGMPAEATEGVTLLTEHIWSVETTGRWTTARHLAYLSVNDEGAKANREETIRYRKGDQQFILLFAETILPDGTHVPVDPKTVRLEPDDTRKDFPAYAGIVQAKIEFPRVGPGCITHFGYLITQQSTPVPGEFARTIDWLASWPVTEEHIEVDLPDSLSDRLTITALGDGVPSPVTKRTGDRTIRTWTLRNLPGGRFEYRGPPATQVGPAVFLTTLRSWDSIARWYAERLRGRDELTAALRKEMDEWTKGISDPWNVLAVLHAKVADEVKSVGGELGVADFEPLPCSQVWANRYGDRFDKANLLVAMLRAKGLTAHVALVNADNMGRIERRSPDYHQLGQALVAVKQGGGGYLFCDPSQAHSIPGQLSWNQTERDALVLLGDRAEWVRTPAQSVGTLRFNYMLSLTAARELHGWLIYDSDGSYGAYERTRLGSLDNDALRTQMAGTLKGGFSGAEVVDAGCGELPQDGKLSVRTYFVDTLAAGQDKTTVELPFPASPDIFFDVGEAAERRTEFLTARDGVSVRATIHLPAGASLAKVPAPFREETRSYLAEARWEFANGNVKVLLNLETRAAVFSPEEFRSLYKTTKALQAWVKQPLVVSLAKVASADGVPPPVDAMPKMPTGDGQIGLIDRWYPSTGDKTVRRTALARCAQLFADDEETVFRARVRAALTRWDEGKPEEAHRELAPLIEIVSGRVGQGVRDWANLNDGLILRDLGRLREAVDRLLPIAERSDASRDYRVIATEESFDMKGDETAERLLPVFDELVREDGTNGGLRSRLLHALLIRSNDAAVRTRLTDLFTEDPKAARSFFASCLADAAGWNWAGDAARRGRLAGIIGQIDREPSKEIARALGFFREEQHLDQLRERLVRRLDQRAGPGWQVAFDEGRDGSAPGAKVRPLDQAAAMKVREFASTVSMIEAHASLRTAAVADPDSVENRTILLAMMNKALKPVAAPRRTLFGGVSPTALVGRLEGSFSVNNRGRGDYNIELPIPSSRGRVGPSLSASYENSTDDGLLGHSFYFYTGFYGSIVRGRTILARDGRTASQEYRESDPLYLDGKRLLCVSGDDTYGRPGSRYRTEVDQFSVIEARGTGEVTDGFVLTTKSGERYYFGRYEGQDDALQSGLDETRGVLFSVPQTFALKRVEDAFGNFVEMHYRHAGFGEWLLDRIDYTAGPGIAAPYCIELAYERSAHTTAHYAHGLRFDFGHVLRRVEVRHQPGRELVARYDFVYAPTRDGRGPALLSEIRASLSADVGEPLRDLSPMRFAWSGTLNTQTAAVRVLSESSSGKGSPGPADVLAADFDADGRDDLLLAGVTDDRLSLGEEVSDTRCLPAEIQAELVSGRACVRAGDFDGDGRADVLVMTGDEARVFWSRGKAFTKGPELRARLSVSPGGQASMPERSRWLVGDFDGDGRADVILDPQGSAPVLYLSRGDHFEGVENVGDPSAMPNTVRTEAAAVVSRSAPYVCDLNGDGNSDYIWLEAAKQPEGYVLRLVSVLGLPSRRLSSPQVDFEEAIAPMPAGAGPIGDRIPLIVPGDYNGDGLTDFLLVPRGPGGAEPDAQGVLVINRGPASGTPFEGAGGFGHMKTTLWKSFLSPFGPKSGVCALCSLDVDGDGIGDLVWYAPRTEANATASWWCSLSNGDGTFAPAHRLASEPWTGFGRVLESRAAEASAPAGDGLVSIGVTRECDFNGDGLGDWTLARVDQNGELRPLAYALVSSDTGRECPFANVITEFRDGYGKSDLVAYKSAKDPSIYTAGPAVAYPIRDLKAWGPVVAGVWHDSGSEALSGFTYQYAGNHIDLSGRGSMGYLAFTTFDQETTIMKYQFLVHSYPMTGMTRREQTYRFWTGGGKRFLKLLSSTDYRVAYDAVRSLSDGRPWGTVYPFVAFKREAEGYRDDRAGYYCDEGKPLPLAELDQSLPPRPYTLLPSIVDTERWYDLQPLDQWSAAFPDEHALPGYLTYGVETREDVDRSATEFKRVAKLYRETRLREGLDVCQLQASLTVEKNEADRLTVSPLKAYEYLPGSGLLSRETTDGRGATDAKQRALAVSDFDYDSLGRLRERRDSRVDFSQRAPSLTSSVYVRKSRMIDELDVAAKEEDDDGANTSITFNRINRSAHELSFANGHKEVRTFDGLGRQIGLDGTDSGYAKKVDYAWTGPDLEGWKREQTVSPPAGVAGLELKSVYAERTTETGQNCVTKYYDRLNRVIVETSENAKGAVVRSATIYNVLGQVVATTSTQAPGAPVTYTVKDYDAYGVTRGERSVTVHAK